MSNEFLTTLTKPSFDLERHLNVNTGARQPQTVQPSTNDDYSSFYNLCKLAKEHLDKESENQKEEWNQRQKNAMMLVQKDVDYYMEEIKQYLNKSKSGHTKFPTWYESLEEGIFHENWGLSGIYEWIKLGTSSQCKIVQPYIFFHENGKMELKPQTLSRDRYSKIKETLLLNDTSQRKTALYQEIYLTEDIRIEIFNNHKASATAGYIVFRRNVIEKPSFESLAARGTYEPELIPALEGMVDCGFNMCVIGPVKAGKTTFLKAYQSMEDKKLEGVSIETDPEINFNEFMGKAPFMQLIADNEDLERTMKPLMRSDADYFIFPEARDGRALMLLLKVTKKGTRRVKGAFHTSTPEDFPYDVAREIVDVYGGDMWGYMIQTAINFDLLFEFKTDARDGRKKRLVGIYEIEFNRDTFLVRSNAICKYLPNEERWVYHSKFSEETTSRAMDLSPDGFAKIVTTLQALERKNPNLNPYKVSPFSRLVPITGG